MNRLSPKTKLLSLCILVLVHLQLLRAAEINWVPSTNLWNGWTVNWHAVSALNDPNDALGTTHLDFVGDAISPGAYWSDNGFYMFFRARVAAGSVTSSTFADSVLVLIDRVGYGLTNRPDFAFTWDSKASLATHGLEMSISNTVGTTWGTTKMDDLDGLNSSKGTNDINGNSRTTDGFIRTLDNQNTPNFGATTFIDFAVSWDYLTNYTTLRRTDSWRIQLASIDGANDHNFLSYDIAGGLNPSSAIDANWADIQVIPEPSSALLASGGFTLIFSFRRRSRNRA
jgi:hypothetical protein